MFGQYMANLEARSNAAIKTEDCDYVKDGLLHCGHCHTPKQTRLEVLGRVISPKVLCQCAQDRMKKEKEREEKQELLERVKKYRMLGFPESQMQYWTFENDDKSNAKMSEMARRYVNRFDSFYKEGKGLLLHGGVGTGKTYIACMIANALIDKGYPVLVTNFSRVLNTLQGTFEKQEYLDSLNKFKLLVIDDLGIERNTTFAEEQVYNIIDSRVRAGLPMIITTNLTIQEMVTERNIEKKRIYDRVLGKCFPVEVTGESRRMKTLINSNEEMRSLLGI